MSKKMFTIWSVGLVVVFLTGGSLADLTSYDEFDDTAYDGTFNPNLWEWPSSDFYSYQGSGYANLKGYGSEWIKSKTAFDVPDYTSSAYLVVETKLIYWDNHKIYDSFVKLIDYDQGRNFGMVLTYPSYSSGGHYKAYIADGASHDTQLSPYYPDPEPNPDGSGSGDYQGTNSTWDYLRICLGDNGKYWMELKQDESANWQVVYSKQMQQSEWPTTVKFLGDANWGYLRLDYVRYGVIPEPMTLLFMIFSLGYLRRK